MIAYVLWGIAFAISFVIFTSVYSYLYGIGRTVAHSLVSSIMFCGIVFCVLSAVNTGRQEYRHTSTSAYSIVRLDTGEYYTETLAGNVTVKYADTKETKTYYGVAHMILSDKAQIVIERRYTDLLDLLTLSSENNIKATLYVPEIK